jgi:AraC-like DNA-binding protein
MSVNPLRLLVGALASRGISTGELFAVHRIGPALLEDFEMRVPVDEANAIVEHAALLSKIRDFGLFVGSQGPSPSGLPALAAEACGSLREALRAVCRYHPLITGVGRFELVEEHAHALLIWNTDGCDVPVSRHWADLYLSSLLRRGRDLTGVDWNPSAVRFRHARPPNTTAHQRFFRAPLSFDQRAHELELDRKLLDLPFRTADPNLRRIIHRYGDELLERLEPEEDIISTVRHIVSSSLGSDEATLDRLAARLHTTPRTLQRRLSSEGVSLRSLIDEARREQALLHVANSDRALAEIAELLGFDAVSSFHRAFRRWTGVTPAQYQHSKARR